MIGRLSRFVGLFRGVFVPLGLFALVAVGIHAGSDRVDDYSFVVLNWIDAIFDRGLSAIVGFLWDLFGASKESVALATYRVVDLVDLEVKHWAARAIALAVEVSADLILALPVFFYRRKGGTLSTLLKDTFRDPTLLKFAAPAAVAFASIAGLFVVSQEVQAETYALMIKLHATARVAGNIAGVFAAVVLAIVAWRLAAVVTLGAVRWADVRARNDRSMSAAAKKRRLRGVGVAAIALPIACLALFQATEIITHLRSLMPT